VDGRLKVTGAATYSAEFNIPGLVYGVAVESTVAKGRINNIDTRKAEKVPGVIGVMTWKNAMSLHFPQGSDPGSGKYAEKDLLPVQSDRVFYDGQHIAVVVAETFEQAEYAASLIKVDYEQEKPVHILKNAMSDAYKPKAGIGGSEVQTKRGNTDAGLQLAATKVTQTYDTPVYHHNPMEPHATIAVWEGKKLTVYDSTQSVYGSKTLLSQMMGVQPENMRVVCLYIGGGFGSKGFMWPNTLLASMAAKQFNRPVKLVLSRQQMFTGAGRRSQTLQNIKLGATSDGKLTAIGHENIVESSFVDEFVEPAGVATSILYQSPNVDVSHILARLNKVTPCPMRAPGEAVGTYGLEVAMDELAYKLNMDPVQLRVVNHADMEPQKMKAWSEKSLLECYKRGAEAIGWSQRSQQPGAHRDGKYLIGYGMATATYPANRSASTAKVVLFSDGHAEFFCATQDIGTGTYTVMTQIAADAIGLPVDKIKMKLGDSDYPKGANSGGSQVTASVGPAIRAAGIGLIGKLTKMAVGDRNSPLHGYQEQDVIAANGRLVLKDKPERGESLVDILSRSGMQKVEALANTDVSTRQQTESNPAAKGGGSEEEAKAESKNNPAVQEDEQIDRKPYVFHSFGAQFVKVRVDADLGTVHLEKVVAVMDTGRVMNMKTAKNQIMGGMIFGMGMALMEETKYDDNNGRVVTRDLAQYLVPVNADMPDFDVQFIGTPDPFISPLGARGIGEIGITGITAAIANAVYNATGKRVRDLPITPDKLIASKNEQMI
jgi:xanthine dehydrogenase YagR molybdenum-binding subunit